MQYLASSEAYFFFYFSCTLNNHFCFSFQGDQKFNVGKRQSVKPSAYKKNHNFKVSAEILGVAPEFILAINPLSPNSDQH